MCRIRSRPTTRTVRKLPRNKQPAFPAHLHAAKTLIEARNDAPKSLRESQRLGIAQFRLAIVAQHGLAVLVANRLPVIFR